MRRILTALAALTASLLVSHHVLSAQSASASLAVTANVIKNCTISTAPVNFGAYDPVAANATAPLDGIGTVTVTCTKGAVAKVGLNPGANAQGTTRRMTQGAAEYLTYEVYKDTGHANVWGDTIDTALDIPAAPNRNPRTFTVYGRVEAGTGRHGRQLLRHRRRDGELLG